MARIPNGIQGPVQGKVGTVIGSSRNGIPYIKGLYKNRTKSVSKKELANRKKFAAAQSWLLKNSFVPDASGLRIDPALVKLSFGNLPLPANLAVNLTETGDLKFTWDPAYKDGTDRSDQIMMLAYDVEKSHAVFNTTGQLRSTGTDILTLDRTYGKNFHVYAAFNAYDRSRQSDSVYLGEWKI